jgi:hypothetical protein
VVLAALRGGVWSHDHFLQNSSLFVLRIASFSTGSVLSREDGRKMGCTQRVARIKEMRNALRTLVRRFEDLDTMGR